MKPNTALPSSPAILTTTVGSYPVPDWLSALPSGQAVLDATRKLYARHTVVANQRYPSHFQCPRSGFRS